MASVANVGKNVSFLAASASRAAIHKTFAIHENLGTVLCCVLRIPIINKI
jgi:hypothetical protein